MKIMKTVPAAIVALAFAALPALASANPKLDFDGSRHFTIENEEGHISRLRSESDTISCETLTGTGEFDESGQTGTIEFTFHGCKDSLGFNCTTSGQPTGTITTNELPFHLVTLTEKETPGVLITPNSGEGDFATFNCFIISVTLTGNGVIGDLTAPDYNVSTDEFTLDFECNEVEQQVHTTHDGNPTIGYDLVEDIGSEEETLCLEATIISTFTNGDEATLTHGE